MSFSIQHRFAAAPEVVWARLADHEGMPGWAGVRSARLVQLGQGDRNGVGAVRRLGLLPGLAIDEEVVGFEPPRRLEYRLIAGLPGLLRHHGSVTLEPDGDRGTRVVWSVDLKMRAGARLAGVLIELAVREGLRRGLATLDRQLQRAHAA